MKKTSLVLLIGLGLLATSAWATSDKSVYCKEDGGDGSNDERYTVTENKTESSSTFTCDWASDDYPTKTVDNDKASHIKIYCQRTGDSKTYVPTAFNVYVDNDGLYCQEPETSPQTEYYDLYCDNDSNYNHKVKVKSVSCNTDGTNPATTTIDEDN